MKYPPTPLSGAVLAITGGARDIGHETARVFPGRGAAVCIGDLAHHAARRTAAELGHGVRAFGVDVTDRSPFVRSRQAWPSRQAHWTSWSTSPRWPGRSPIAGMALYNNGAKYTDRACKATLGPRGEHHQHLIEQCRRRA